MRCNRNALFAILWIYYVSCKKQSFGLGHVKRKVRVVCDFFYYFTGPVEIAADGIQREFDCLG